MAVHPDVASSSILHRNLVERPKVVVGGNGTSLILSDGSEMIDASCGPAVSVLGHNRPDIAKAISDQMAKISYTYSGSQFTSQPCEELATFLLQHQPGGLSKAIFVNSGSEATDAALKLATQYWHEKGQPQRCKFIARKQSYHGNTLGALCVSGHTARRHMYAAWMSSNVAFVDPCYAYRGKALGESDANYLTRLEKQLDDEFQRLGPENVAAFIAEPVSGTTLGCVAAVPGYFQALPDDCTCGLMMDIE